MTKTHAENLMVPHVTTASPNGSTVCAQSFLDAFPSTGSWSCWGSTDTLPTKKPDANSIVFIIDDDAQVRSNLMNLCRSVELNVKVFSSPNEFLNTPRPDHSACVVLEVLFPGSAPHGLEFQRTLVSMNDFLPIIFLTGHGDIRISVKAIKGGALDFLTKPACEQDLLHAIRKGIDRDRERRKKEQAISSLRKRYDSLSTREREIMHLVTRGLLNKQVGAELNLHLVTVKGHRGRIMQKMAAKSLAELVRMSDLVSPPQKHH